MEGGDQPVLQRRLQVDHQVAARQQVQPGEGRVLDDALHREDHALAHLLADAVAGVLPHEEALEALWRHVQRDVVRVQADAGEGDGVVVEVGAVELHRVLAVGLVHPLAQQHGDRVGLLPRGAARHPDAQHIAGGLALQQGGQDVALEHLERGGVTEEARHVDQQLPEQHVDLVGLLVEVAGVDLGVADVVLGHAPLDAPAQRGLLVEREIVAGGLAQRLEDARQHVGQQAGAVDLARLGPGVAAQQVDHAVDRHHPRVAAAVQGAGGHAVVQGAAGLLHQAQPAGLRQRPQAQRAVRAGAREHDARRLRALVSRQRGQEAVDRQAQAAPLQRRHQRQRAAGDAHVAVGRDHVEVVGLHRHLVLHLDHGHGRAALQDLGQHARVAGVQVLDQHEGQAAVDRHQAEELLVGLQPAGRRTERDDAQRPGRRHAGTARARGGQGRALEAEHRLGRGWRQQQRRRRRGGDQTDGGGGRWSRRGGIRRPGGRFNRQASHPLSQGPVMGRTCGGRGPLRACGALSLWDADDTPCRPPNHPQDSTLALWLAAPVRISW